MPKLVAKLVVVVPRESTDEHTFAVVTCNRTDKIVDAETLLDAIIAAVTEWASTKEGQAAYAGSHQDLNVGDLAGELGSKGLQKLLKKHGVCGLTIDTFSNSDRHNWSFDTVLVDESKLSNDE